MDLKNKTCLITGGTKGIGAATPLLFAQLGAKISIVARRLDDPEAQRTRQSLAQLGAQTAFIQADIAKPADCAACVAQTVQQLGEVDVLVHSAGGLVTGGLLDVSPDAWTSAFDVHVHAAYHLCR